MNLNIALGSLACEPPGWLMAGIHADDLLVINAATNPRRRGELLWSRGLKAGLVARMLEDDGRENDGCHEATLPMRISISHDRCLTAVAISRYGEIGVDLQTDYPLESCYQIAETWFPELESKEILATNSCDRFMLSWVIKEAWAKCMSASIFETCRTIGVWKGMVHITGEAVGIPQFAWSRQYFSTNKKLADGGLPAGAGATNPGAPEAKFAVGICFKAKVSGTPNIECLVPGLNSELRHFAVDWEWIPVAGYDDKAHD